MSSIFSLNDPRAAEPAQAGGKAAGLARLIAAGARVPGGFCIGTDAYVAHLAAAGVDGLIDAVCDADGDLDALTSKIRDTITAAPVPAGPAEDLALAYRDLGEGTFVAVRSSGTAEDLAEASFAGLHDTYLDVRGTDAVLDAVRRCWASMWSVRATAYRRTHGFDHRDARLAVVVQRMVAAEASGVMFTANPVTAATDETVVNAAYGLGESVVSGVVTPDQFVVRDRLVLERTLGAKEIRIVRAPAGGTVTEEVPPADRARFCLDDDRVRALAGLGARLRDDLGGLPLDVEWALLGDEFHVLQARPITGVEFSWDADVDAWQTLVDEPDAVWTRAMSDEGWTGAKTPLMYAWRAESWTRSVKAAARLWGVPELAETRLWKFHRGEAYYNCAAERITVQRTFPPFLRPPVLARIPAAWQADVQAAPLRWAQWLKVYARLQLLSDRLGPLNWFGLIDDWITCGPGRMPDHTDPELRELSDAGLKAHIGAITEFERRYCDDIFIPFFLYARDALSALTVLVTRWYTGDNPAILADVLTGTSKQTITQRENHALWTLAEMIRAAPGLRALFESRDAGGFLAGLDGTSDGQAFRAAYDEFLSWSGHRGHSDRDLIFPRRIEDPNLDHRALGSLLSIPDPVDPAVREEEVRAARERAIDALVDDVRRQPLGWLKAEVLKFVVDYSDRFLMVRDNERAFVDRSTFAAKRALAEVGRRLSERDLLPAGEHYFLTLAELYGLLDGRSDPALAATKAAARRRDFERVDRKELTPPPYLQHNRGVDLDSVGEAGGLLGLGTSRGVVTGTARIVKTLDGIGRARHGDILVCNATDPGWTPVFVVVSGIVLETGGMLAHASCLAREYGLPAVQLPGAMRAIPDGATITVNGDTGEVTVSEEGVNR